MQEKKRSRRNMIYLDDPSFCYSEFESDAKAYCKEHKITQDLFSRMCGNKSHSMLASARRYKCINKESFKMACEIIGHSERDYFRVVPASPETEQNPAPVSSIQTPDTLATDEIIREMKEQTQVMKEIVEALNALSSAWNS